MASGLEREKRLLDERARSALARHQLPLDRLRTNPLLDPSRASLMRERLKTNRERQGATLY